VKQAAELKSSVYFRFPFDRVLLTFHVDISNTPNLLKRVEEKKKSRQIILEEILRFK
jgi:hypothetical protein